MSRPQLEGARKRSEIAWKPGGGMQRRRGAAPVPAKVAGPAAAGIACGLLIVTVDGCYIYIYIVPRCGVVRMMIDE